MQHARDEEDHRARRVHVPASPDQRRVEVPPHEVSHREIPGAPVQADAAAVPPVPVELAVVESHELGQGVEVRVEEREEARQPDDEGDGRQLHQSLQQRCHVHRLDRVQRVAKHRGRVLRRRDPDEHAERGRFGQALRHESPANVRRAGVDGLIDERRRPPEIGEVCEGDVPWVGARRVDGRQFGRRRLRQQRMPQVTIGERIRADLKGENDGVHLTEGADEGMMDHPIHHRAGQS